MIRLLVGRGMECEDQIVREVLASEKEAGQGRERESNVRHRDQHPRPGHWHQPDE